MRTTEQTINCPYRVGAYCEYPATGSKASHNLEQKRLVDEAFA